MVIYEVNLEVNEEIESEFAAWLDSHIREILRIEGFIGAQWFVRDARYEELGSSRKFWTIHYSLRDRSILDHYLNALAPKMRESAARFKDRFRATRRILESPKTFSR